MYYVCPLTSLLLSQSIIHHSMNMMRRQQRYGIGIGDTGCLANYGIDVMRCYIPHRHVDIKTGGRTENENEGKVNKTVVNHNM